jgi:3-deoxy-D-manno-octulosonic-acid transferase
MGSYRETVQLLPRVWEIGWVRRLRRRWRRPLQTLSGPLLANYIKLAIKTSSRSADPPDYLDRGRALHPYILALWHGQFLLEPGLYPRDVPLRVMVARHDDAEGLAEALRQLGIGLIRGAGAGGRSSDRGGAKAARQAVDSLRDGVSISMTADVPPGPARKCGLGIVMLSSLSGRPIIPFAVASSHYRTLNTWSRMTINLPFSKLGVVMGDPIFVPRRVSRN